MKFSGVIQGILRHKLYRKLSDAIRPVIRHRLFPPIAGAGLTILCGLILMNPPIGELWTLASYDYLFRFGARTNINPNQIALVLMDNAAYGYYTNEVRGEPWSRARHAELLNKLADDRCALVIFDVNFEIPREPASDQALAAALRRQRGVVLMADLETSEHRKPNQKLESMSPTLPAELFLEAAGTNWGVAWFTPDSDGVVRRHWPFPSPDVNPTLTWRAAELAGAHLDHTPGERWLRYYGERGPWTSLSYHFAMGQAPNFFADKIVFIGNKPKTSMPDDEMGDEFRTPYTRWSGDSMGGVDIQAAAFLNLLNNEWLRRPPRWTEVVMYMVIGTLLGGLLCRAGALAALGYAAGASLIISLSAVSLSYFTNFWFPWLIPAGAQVPCALAWALAVRYRPRSIHEQLTTINIIPEVPDYDLVQPPFGHGAYGRVWLARNAVGQWQALKAVYRDSFPDRVEPFERELRGIERYKPVSDKHPGLLRVDFVSRPKSEGYFYYVMELGDAQSPGWEKNPTSYRPRDLECVRREAERNRLSARECVRIALALAEALDFLHRQDLTHRDIKPKNIVFVNGRPKLADVGLVAEIDRPTADRTYVGTPGYMPPWPEPPGTVQADIYGLGMVLYVISTGHDPVLFPELSVSLIDSVDSVDFILLNAVIIRACQPDCALRYSSAAEMAEALRDVEKLMAAPRHAGKPPASPI